MSPRNVPPAAGGAAQLRPKKSSKRNANPSKARGGGRRPADAPTPAVATIDPSTYLRLLERSCPGEVSRSYCGDDAEDAEVRRWFLGCQGLDVHAGELVAKAMRDADRGKWFGADLSSRSRRSNVQRSVRMRCCEQ